MRRLCTRVSSLPRRGGVRQPRQEVPAGLGYCGQVPLPMPFFSGVQCRVYSTRLPLPPTLGGDQPRKGRGAPTGAGQWSIVDAANRAGPGRCPWVVCLLMLGPIVAHMFYPVKSRGLRDLGVCTAHASSGPQAPVATQPSRRTYDTQVAVCRGDWLTLSSYPSIMAPSVCFSEE